MVLLQLKKLDVYPLSRKDGRDGMTEEEKNYSFVEAAKILCLKFEDLNLVQ